VLAAERSLKPFDHGCVDFIRDPDHFLKVGRVINVEQRVDVGVSVSDVSIDCDRDV